MLSVGTNSMTVHHNYAKNSAVSNIQAIQFFPNQNYACRSQTVGSNIHSPNTRRNWLAMYTL